MGLNPTDTIIDRLNIRAALPAHASRATGELRTASWPSSLDNSWIFLRSVHVRGPQARIARDAAESARQLAGSAVDGRLPGAHSADAVRFENLSQMLAWLLADITAGRAHTRWYWKQWLRLFRLPQSQALTQLLSEHAEHMTAIVAELDSIGALAPVWQHLSSQGATQLLAELSRATGVRVHAVVSIDSTSNVPSPDILPGFDGIPRSPQWQRVLRRWQSPLTAIPIHDVRFSLAAALIAVETFPSYLHREPLMLLDTVRVTLQRLIVEREVVLLSKERQQSEPGDFGTEGPSTPGGIGRQADVLPVASASPALLSQQIGKTRIAELPFVEEGLPNESLRESGHEGKGRLASAPESAGRVDSVVSGDDVTRDSAVFQTSIPDSHESEHPAVLGNVFYTHQGGLFYLINALNHPSVRAVLDDADAWTRLPSGWAWLFRIGQTLGLDETDNIGRFFAVQMGFDSLDQLHKLPPLPLADRLVPLLRDVYDRNDVWNPGLLNVEARITHTASHIDVEFPMSAVRLAVRLAGLDINPHWVPWLGRVVTFHYVSSSFGGEGAA